MHSAQEDKKSRFTLSQLWQVVKGTRKNFRNKHLHNRVVNKVLKNNFDVNYKVTINDCQKSKNYLKDCTALHFVYYNVHDIDTFNTLLKREADFTIKNGNSQTVLHLVMTKYYLYYNIEDEIPFINSVLSAHVKLQNFVNPHDDNGFSHLHVACIANHAEAVELFLNNGASIDETVDSNESQFGGYTPLHFAAEFYSFKVARILVSRGADVNAQTAKGKSPVDILIENIHDYCFSEEKEQIIKILLEKDGVSTVGLSSLHIACTFKDLKIAERILDEGADIDYAVPMESPTFPGHTALHFAANNSIEAVKILVTRGAEMEVASAYGRIPLQICIVKYSFEDVCNILTCIENFRNIRLSDGKTRLLDLIPEMRNLNQFQMFLENKIKDIGAVIPSDSILWPGYTMLHLAVTLSKKLEYHSENSEQQNAKFIVEECLRRSLNVNTQDSKGRTPIHLAFIQGKDNIVNLLLVYLNVFENVANVVDEDNLSYLHIACAMKDEALAEALLRNADPNIVYNGKSIDNRVIKPGATPLHAVAANGSHAIADMLVRHGANVRATDKDGLTPIHWLIFNHYLFGSDYQRISNVLFGALSANLVENCVVNDLEMTYLHIACFFGNVEVVKQLLDIGLDVNALINCEALSNNKLLELALARFKTYSNLTPLHMAIQEKPDDDVLDLLLNRGADIFVKGSMGSSISSPCIPIKNKQVLRCFFKVLWNRDDMRECMERKLGLTKLHIACYMKNEKAIRSVLDDSIDINAQVYADSEIFAGCTPLQLLMTTIVSEDLFNVQFAESTIISMTSLLLDHGADVTIMNAEKDTLIHTFYKYQKGFFDGIRCKDLLLNAQRNFSVNPVNADGLSHFHLACLWHQVEVVEKFLQHGSVDVNQPIDCFARFAAGCTPLHLVLSEIVPLNDWRGKLSQTVDLLLKHGADVTAKDVHGETPLHKHAIMYYPEMSIIDKLVSCGGDMKSENVRGQTPIEVWPDNNPITLFPSDYAQIFQKYNYKINSWNRLTGEGYISKIFLSDSGDLCENSEFERFLKLEDVRTVDDVGRTVIHNSVAHSRSRYFPSSIDRNYMYAIESFIKIGIDIDQQDKLGQTALHYASRLENVPGVEALLACGADVNIVDKSGKSALSYAIKNSNVKNDLSYIIQTNVTIALRLHIQKLQCLKIEVSQLNQSLIKKVQHFFDKPYHSESNKVFHKPPQTFFSQIEMTKTLDIEINSLTLFDFLSETAAVNFYVFLPKFKRDIVDDFLKSIDFHKVKELAGIIKLQFKKMIARLELIDSALSSLRTLLGFSVPGLCELISQFLLNTDLKNLIQSAALNTKKRKRSTSS